MAKTPVVLYKVLVIGIIILFVGVSFSPVIIAVDLSNQDSVKLNNNTSSVLDISGNGYDIAIVEIIPYYFADDEPTYFHNLYFGPKIMNIGDAPYTGKTGYTAVAINLRYNEVEDTFETIRGGGLEPGESWSASRGYGLEFEGYYFPTLFSLQFFVTPTDSNPENNYFEDKYLIWGGFFAPNYKHLSDITPRNRVATNTLLIRFLEHLPFLGVFLRAMNLLK